MGRSCSWIAVRTGDKSGLLDRLGMVETGELIEPGCDQSPMSVHQTHSGWTILFAEDFDWATPERTVEFSAFGLTLGVQTEDRSEMETSVTAAEKGHVQWRVSHANVPGRLLEVSGKPPAEYEALRRKYQRKQAEEEDVDWLLEIPLELARKISGYSIDENPEEFIALDWAAPPAAFPVPPRRQTPGRKQPQTRVDRPRRFSFRSRCSAIAIHSDARDAVLAHLGLVETGKMVWPGKGDSSLALQETQTGWLIVFSEDFFWATSRRVRGLSKFGFAIGFSLQGGDWEDMWPTDVADAGRVIPLYDKDTHLLAVPADLRARMDRTVRQLEQDLQTGWSRARSARFFRLLLGYEFRHEIVQFAALKRRWPWTRPRGAKQVKPFG